MSYIKLFEEYNFKEIKEIVNSKIDWKLFRSIEDIMLKYFDESYRCYLYIDMGSGDKYCPIYGSEILNNPRRRGWTEDWDDILSVIKKSSGDANCTLYYVSRVYKVSEDKEVIVVDSYKQAVSTLLTRNFPDYKFSDDHDQIIVETKIVIPKL